MLENAVAPLAELHQVKINADLEKTKNGRNFMSVIFSSSEAWGGRNCTNYTDGTGNFV